MTERNLLIFIDWYYPSFKAGGPIKSVFNIAQSLKEELKISIVTSAYDLGETEALEGIELNKWTLHQGVKVIYLNRENQNSARYKALIKEVSPDLIYFNSLFSTAFTIKPLVAAKQLKLGEIIVAPRGMLGEGALEIKPLKKRAYLTVSKLFGLFSNVHWHASSGYEKVEIQNVFGKKAVVTIAQNIAGKVNQRKLSPNFKTSSELKLVFFSRINEKKNLIFAIEVLKKLNLETISLAIYGPIEDKIYWNNCQELMKGSKVNFEYKGLIHPSELERVLGNYHYLFFPSKHENYGHVIAESFCASLPVMISQNTPWRNLEGQNVGYDLPLEVAKFQDTITSLIAENREVYLTKVNATYKYSLDHIVNSAVVDQNRKLFL